MSKKDNTIIIKKTSQVKEVVDEQTQVFKDYKDYLIQAWKEKANQRNQEVHFKQDKEGSIATRA